MTEQPLSGSETGRTCAECQRARKIMAKGLCNTCYQRQWRATNPRTYSEDEKARSRERTAKWHERHPERHRENCRRWASQNPHKNAEYQRRYKAKLSPEQRRAIWIKSKYRLTDEQYAEIVAHPDTCDACGASFEEVRRNIDHCHTTGEFRGLLCHGCNTAAGMLGDSAVRAGQLAAYLRRVKQD